VFLGSENFAQKSEAWGSGVSVRDERCPSKGGSVDVFLATQVVAIRNVSSAHRWRLPEAYARGVQALGALGCGRAGTAGFFVLRSTAAGFEAISVTRAAMSAAAVRARRQSRRGPAGRDRARVEVRCSGRDCSLHGIGGREMTRWDAAEAPTRFCVDADVQVVAHIPAGRLGMLIWGVRIRCDAVGHWLRVLQ
jgi:hypothetical protein